MEQHVAVLPQEQTRNQIGLRAVSGCPLHQGEKMYQLHTWCRLLPQLAQQPWLAQQGGWSQNSAHSQPVPAHSLSIATGGEVAKPFPMLVPMRWVTSAGK